MFELSEFWFSRVFCCYLDTEGNKRIVQEKFDILTGNFVVLILSYHGKNAYFTNQNDSRWWENLWNKRLLNSMELSSISAMSWRFVLLVEENGVAGENHRPTASHWQALSHYVASSTPRLNFKGELSVLLWLAEIFFHTDMFPIFWFDS